MSGFHPMAEARVVDESYSEGCPVMLSAFHQALNTHLGLALRCKLWVCFGYVLQFMRMQHLDSFLLLDIIAAALMVLLPTTKAGIKKASVNQPQAPSS